MPQPPELPVELGDRFRVSDALNAGVDAGRLRRRDLERPFHGVRTRADATIPEAFEVDSAGLRRGEPERRHLKQALDYSTRMPEHEFFGHVTAAVAYGWPLPASVLRGRDLDVAVRAPLRLPRSKGVRGHQVIADHVKVREDPRTGLLLADPATTWAMLASVLTDLYDLVAVGDAAVREWRVDAPLATIADLEVAAAAGRRRGVPRMRAALPLIRPRSASRPETHCRLTIVAAGLPEPELNHDVYANGVKIACVDLAYPRLQIAVEYEGEHHLLDPEQWARDIQRYEQLAAAGWHVIRVTKAELFDGPAMLVRRVRAAIAARS